MIFQKILNRGTIGRFRCFLGLFQLEFYAEYDAIKISPPSIFVFELQPFENLPPIFQK